MKSENDTMQSQNKESSSNDDLQVASEDGLIIERRFTSAGDDPFDAFNWISMDVEIRNPDGTMADAIEGVQLPSGFSGVPGKVCAQKYLRKIAEMVNADLGIISVGPNRSQTFNA